MGPLTKILRRRRRRRLRGRIGYSVLEGATVKKQHGSTVVEVPNAEEITAGITMADQIQSTKIVAITLTLLGGEVSTFAD